VREIIKEELADGVVVGEERIREIVRDELENWHIRKPPITGDEIAEILPPSSVVPKEQTWRQKAKELNIPIQKETGGMRKKVDVLADIEAKQNESSQEREIDAQISEELRTEEQAGSGGSQ